VAAPRFPVSIKGVVLIGGRVVLLKNERDEWELPGGRLESGEDPEACLVREISEELSIRVEVGPLLDCWRYEVGRGEVVIVTYGCRTADRTVTRSAEHSAAGVFAIDAIGALRMPDGYRRSIRAWQQRVKES
jgi:8-oxo-dGTP pyrophosphatase MutT (NUDIX family)